MTQKSMNISRIINELTQYRNLKYIKMMMMSTLFVVPTFKYLCLWNSKYWFF